MSASLTPINSHFAKLITKITLKARQSRVYGPHFTFRECDVMLAGRVGRGLFQGQMRWRSNRASSHVRHHWAQPAWCCIHLDLEDKTVPSCRSSPGRFGRVQGLGSTQTLLLSRFSASPPTFHLCCASASLGIMVQ